MNEMPLSAFNSIWWDGDCQFQRQTVGAVKCCMHARTHTSTLWPNCGHRSSVHKRNINIKSDVRRHLRSHDDYTTTHHYCNEHASRRVGTYYLYKHSASCVFSAVRQTLILSRILLILVVVFCCVSSVWKVVRSVVRWINKRVSETKKVKWMTQWVSTNSMAFLTSATINRSKKSKKRYISQRKWRIELYSQLMHSQSVWVICTAHCNAACAQFMRSANTIFFIHAVIASK